MADQSLRVLQVSTADLGGGAEKVAWNLFEAYRARGYDSWLAVGHRRSGDPDVLPIPNYELHEGWFHFWSKIHLRLQSLEGRVRLVQYVSCLSNWLAQPGRSFDRYRGIETFRFPATRRLLRMPPRPPNIVHGHNLHSSTGYFDIHYLPTLSRRVPTVLTLHDAWLLSGHCAHSFECERWRMGCGQCPDLTIYPAIRRDATAYNWRRKQKIYAACRLYIATPSRWLMQKVGQSMLASAVVDTRVIPNGVDLRVFHPADRAAARAALGLPLGARVLLFTAHGIRHNLWKDYQTLRAAVALVAEHLRGQSLIFVALGEDAPSECVGEAEVRFVAFQQEQKSVACYYQAADIYLHAARADTFPNTILEALACGTPVVATAVGGIPEQVKPLGPASVGTFERSDEPTGILVPPGDAHGMAEQIGRLLRDDALRCQLGENAARDARRRFDMARQVDDYLAWYREILDRRNGISSTY